MTRSEIALTGTALRQRWAMTDEKRAALVDMLFEVATNSESERERISAARALIAVEKQNQDDEFKAAPKLPSSHLHVHVTEDELAEKRRIATNLLSRLGLIVPAGDGRADCVPDPAVAER